MKTASIAAMLFVNIILHVFAQVGFKQSAMSVGTRGFVAWQAIGNVSGFLGVLALTYVLRYAPLSLALAFSWGLGFVAAEVVGAHLIFREVISPLQWAGVALIGGGLILMSLGRSG